MQTGVYLLLGPRPDGEGDMLYVGEGDPRLYQFTQDYSFSSPSTAAAVVLGRSANGRIEWKAADGRTLKELQEAEAHS